MPSRHLSSPGLADHWGELDPTLNPDLNNLAGWYAPLDGYTIVLEVDGEIAGTGTMHRQDDLTGVLVRMSVSKDHRGQGIGKRLVRALVEEGVRRGYSAIVCETTDTWTDAISLYTSVGFAIVDHRDGDYFFRLEI